MALDPAGRYAYVANAASANMSVIRIVNAKPNRFSRQARTPRFGPSGHITTGAEPWNIVASPDGRRVFVANSGQDTITVLNVAGRKLIGHVDLRNSVCNEPDQARTFQPRGMAVTEEQQPLYVTRFLSFTRPGGVQADDNGREGVVCRLNIKTASTQDRRLQAGPAHPLGAAGDRLHDRRDRRRVPDADLGVPQPAAEHRDQGQPRLPAQHRRLADRPAAVQRRHARVRQRDRRRQRRTASDQSAASSSTCTWARATRSRARRSSSSPTSGRSPSRGSNAYAVSAGSDLLVKLSVDGTGKLNFTVDADTTRYIDLNDPANPATSGANAGKNPLGIVVNKQGTRAYVMNFVSRNVSVVNLKTDQVVKVIRTDRLPTPGLARGGRARSARRCSSPRAATSTARPAPRSRPTSVSRARAGRTARAATSRASPTAWSGRSATGRASRCR